MCKKRKSPKRQKSFKISSKIADNQDKKIKEKPMRII